MIGRDELFALALDHNLVPDGMFTAWEPFGQWQRDACDYFGGPRDKVILDIGCGPFRFGSYVAADLGAGHFIGIEPFKPYLEIGKEIAKRLNVSDKVTLSGSAEFDIPTERNIDFAMCHAVFTHLSYEQIWNCLEKMAPVMANNAPFIFTFNLSGVGRVIHRGRLYAEQMPLISAHLADESVFFDFCAKHGGSYERFDEVKHPGQTCALIKFASR